jgi:hypothetical protein
MERGIIMALHSAIIGVLLYLGMVFALGQQAAVAENRSVLIASAVLIYMILLGHGLPTKLNSAL